MSTESGDLIKDALRKRLRRIVERVQLPDSKQRLVRFVDSLIAHAPPSDQPRLRDEFDALMGQLD